MSSSSQPPSTLPQGFSVYQPSLGTPLQFLPALGTQELDDLIDAFIPGPSPASEKRTAVSLDFFQHLELTGQSFKFYPVWSAPSPATSLSTTSPSLDSIGSSHNPSPVTSSWDWSATSASSPRAPTQRRQASKRSSLPSRHQTTDFAHLPGMKILTKDGRDVTNSASRGCKTKEQRDHAHLMRIIKACDACRRKKIRCDPSHKKRAAPTTSAKNAPRSAKKANSAVSHEPPPCIQPTMDEFDFTFPPSSFDFDLSSVLPDLENFATADSSIDPLEEFLQFPPLDGFETDVPLDLGDSSSLDTTSVSPASASLPFETSMAPSVQEPGAPPGPDAVNPDLPARSPGLSSTAFAGNLNDYKDFNLYSPASSFSEDERMISIESSSTSSPDFVELPALAPTLVGDGSDGRTMDAIESARSRSNIDPPSSLDGLAEAGPQAIAEAGDDCCGAHLVSDQSDAPYAPRLIQLPALTEVLSQIPTTHSRSNTTTKTTKDGTRRNDHQRLSEHPVRTHQELTRPNSASTPASLKCDKGEPKTPTRSSSDPNGSSAQHAAAKIAETCGPALYSLALYVLGFTMASLTKSPASGLLAAALQAKQQAPRISSYQRDAHLLQRELCLHVPAICAA